MNLIESNAILVDVAHLALKAGLFTTFEQANQVGLATEVSTIFVNETAIDAKSGNFNPKSHFANAENQIEKNDLNGDEKTDSEKTDSDISESIRE
jgi:hypothetical protein